MKKLIVVAVIMIIAGNRSHSHDPWCKDWPPKPQIITVANVWEICALGANPGRIIEARWHKSEPILVLLELASVTAAQPSRPAFYVWDVENNVGRFGVGDWAFTQMELTPELIAIGTDTGSVMFWDLMQETFLYELEVHEGEVSELLLHPSEDWLAVVINKSRLFRLDLETRSVAEIHLQDSEGLTIHPLAFSNDGRLLAVAGTEAIGIWDTADWAARARAAFASDVPVSLHFAKRDSALLLLADKSVSRWSLAGNNLEFVQTLKRKRAVPQCMLLGGDISPDGSLLVGTDKCGQLRAWNWENGYELGVLGRLRNVAEEHIGVPTRFSPDGRFLVERVNGCCFTLVIVPDAENSH